MGILTITFKVVNEYRAWKSYDKILHETEDVKSAVSKFVKLHNKRSLAILDGPELVLILVHQEKEIGRYTGLSNGKETKEKVLSEIKSMIENCATESDK